ncbi:MAG: ATP-binding protein [Bacteroidota bacterium]
MILGSRAIALLPSVCIAIITTAFLSLFQGISEVALTVTCLISFSASYLLIFIILEFLIFREVSRIQELLEKMSQQDINLDASKKTNPLSPLKRIDEDIFSYAAIKQEEIDKLKKVEAFRREFIADISHELKTPIFAAQGFVHTLLDGAVKDKNVRTKFLKKAAKSLDGLDMLVQDLLTLSHMETGEIKMHFEYLDMRQLVLEIFEQFENKAEKKDIILKFEESLPDDTTVYADRQRISQVLTNLISNSIKYTNDEGEVLINFEDTGDQIITFVKDRGEGIPQEHLHRIFERFYRVDKSRSREKGGTGLGLAIVKHIMERHKSEVQVQSAIGEGSIFSFALPKDKATMPVME